VSRLPAPRPRVRLSAAVNARRLLTPACVLVLALGISACGGTSTAHHAGGQASGINAADANNNGAYVDAGPVTYQLQISRQLNQYITEDSQYVKGLPAGQSASLPADEMWYGVFLWAKNQTDKTQTSTDKFEIVDTQGDTYYPLKLNPALNPFAWTAQALRPGWVQPSPMTIAGQGPTQGGLLLFKVNTNVYSNRPLTLYILGSGNQRLASISLDL
jgi:hypothetical protein